MTVGPLAGIRVIELAGHAPVPFAGMVMADLGADVVRVDPPGGSRHTPPPGPLDRGKSCVEADLKTDAGRELVQGLAAKADVFLEGFRPGVAERLGIGPDDLRAVNPGLVYGRLTGWGQTGPLAPRVGHDINYIALSGALHVIGRAGEPPVPPANLVGDFAGGGMLVVVGVLAALLERRQSDVGQVIDAAMTDGASLLMTFIHGLREAEMWNDERGTNICGWRCRVLRHLPDRRRKLHGGWCGGTGVFRKPHHHNGTRRRGHRLPAGSPIMAAVAGRTGPEIRHQDP